MELLQNSLLACNAPEAANYLNIPTKRWHNVCGVASCLDGAGWVELGGSDAGKDPSRPAESLLRILRSAAAEAAGSSACLSNGAGSNFSVMANSRLEKTNGPVNTGAQQLFVQLFSHLEMMLQGGEGFSCPVLQVWIVAALDMNCPAWSATLP